MVSKLRSLRPPCSWRRPSSLSAAIISSSPPLGASSSTQLQEARHRRAVARLRRLVAGDLDRILDRLGQHRRIAAAEDACAAFLQRLGDRRDRPLRIDRDQLARERLQIGLELVALVQPDAVAEMGADIVADLLALDEQVGGAVGMDHRIGQRDRRVA